MHEIPKLKHITYSLLPINNIQFNLTFNLEIILSMLKLILSKDSIEHIEIKFQTCFFNLSLAKSVFDTFVKTYN
jgi:hypothetical protein